METDANTLGRLRGKLRKLLEFKSGQFTLDRKEVIKILEMLDALQEALRTAETG